MLFAKALRQLFNNKEHFQTAIEIGCGSGFLSKYLLAKNKQLRQCIINDINPYAVQCARDNMKDTRAVFVVGDGLEKMQDKKFDVVICNPPYVPRPRSIDDNPYEGISLLHHFLHHAQEYLTPGGIMLLNISSLCWKLVLQQKPLLPFSIVEKMSVPLKVNNILNNAVWLSYLKKLSLKKQHHQGYDYWHTLHIIKIERKHT